MLALIQELGGCLHKTDLQKYLFLLSTLQNEKSYDFVPYKYGCFSFQAYHDKRYLTETGYLLDNENWTLATDVNFKPSLSASDAACIRRTKLQFGSLRGDQLIHHVYTTYPYYAINSKIAEKILSSIELDAVETCRPKKTGSVLCSIGYEGKSLEEFLNILIKQNIKVLCDVRKNPISRKYGFSKNTLMNALISLGIEYKHFASLGIDTDKRKELVTQADYDKLFSEYEKTVLINNVRDVDVLRNVLGTSKRAAVMCYEKSPAQCHRTRVARAVLNSGADKIDFLEV